MAFLQKKIYLILTSKLLIEGHNICEISLASQIQSLDFTDNEKDAHFKFLIVLVSYSCSKT